MSDTLNGHARRSYVDLDNGRLSMNWKTAAAILIGLFTLFGVWSTFKDSLVQSPDLQAHEESSHAHEAMIKPLTVRVERVEIGLGNVQDGIHDQRAEDLAYRVVANMPRDSSNVDKVRKFQEVKRKAKRNLKQGNDITEGLDAPVF